MHVTSVCAGDAVHVYGSLCVMADCVTVSMDGRGYSVNALLLSFCLSCIGEVANAQLLPIMHWGRSQCLLNFVAAVGQHVPDCRCPVHDWTRHKQEVRYFGVCHCRADSDLNGVAWAVHCVFRRRPPSGVYVKPGTIITTK